MNKFFLFLGVIIVAIGVVAFLWQVDVGQPRRRFTIVTTFYPLTTLTQPIVGDAATIVQLLPAGQGPHDYHPRPSDIATLKSADLLIENGAGLEAQWLDALLKSTNRSDLPVLNLALALKAADLPLLALSEPDGSGLHTDPHLWLAPRNAVAIVGSIADQLIRLDPNKATTYQSNAAAFQAKLQALDTESQRRVGEFGTKQFIAFHDAFTYFARDYGLQQVATIELAPGEAPSPSQLDEIHRLVTAKELKALFTEPQFSSATVDQLARDLGIPLLILDPLETDEGAGGYVAAMQRNLDSLEQALK
ncbi:zinc ABC transporter substrate-binding protein [Candidatus Berkelbacteria bacterium]|nr:zinc ABC transporter substrate-binding protein [Candidatus Berkelbacteria bacterium]